MSAATEEGALPPQAESANADSSANADKSSMNDADANLVDTASNGVSPTPPPVRASPVPPQLPSDNSPASPLMGSISPQIQTVSHRDPKAAAAAASDMKNIVRRKLTGFVGFANLPNQWHRKSVRKGFSFNVMVVGESIISTFVHRAASNLSLQVNPALESRLSSTHCSTLLSTLPRSRNNPVSTSHPPLLPSNPSVPTLRRTVFV
jgi:hypothetical protein